MLLSITANFGAALVLFTSSVNAPVVVLDGAVDDWKDIPAAATDQAGDAAAGEVDFGRVSITDDGEALYLRLDVGRETVLQSPPGGSAGNGIELLIDGDEVARASCTFPGRRTLAGSLECNGVRHAVVATSVPYRLVLTKDTVEVDGSELPLTYQRPRGLFQALYKEAGEGDLVSVITVSAIALSVSSLIVVAVGVWWLR